MQDITILHTKKKSVDIEWTPEENGARGVDGPWRWACVGWKNVSMKFCHCFRKSPCNRTPRALCATNPGSFATTRTRRAPPCSSSRRRRSGHPRRPRRSGETPTRWSSPPPSRTCCAPRSAPAARPLPPRTAALCIWPWRLALITSINRIISTSIPINDVDCTIYY